MAINFTMYRVLCSTPPELESERELFESVNSQFAEKVTMPEEILFPSASFRPGFDPKIHRSIAEANIRMVDFFLQIYGESLPVAAFQDFIQYALKCAADPAMSLRSVSILFPASADEDVRKLRETLTSAGQCDIREYRDRADLETLLHQTLQGWYDSIRVSKSTASA